MKRDEDPDGNWVVVILGVLVLAVMLLLVMLTPVGDAPAGFGQSSHPAVEWRSRSGRDPSPSNRVVTGEYHRRTGT